MYVKGVPFVNRIWKKENSDTRKLRKNSELWVRIELTTLRYTSREELPFLSKMVYKLVRSWTPGRNLPEKNFVGFPLPPRGMKLISRSLLAF